MRVASLDCGMDIPFEAWHQVVTAVWTSDLVSFSEAAVSLTSFSSTMKGKLCFCLPRRDALHPALLDFKRSTCAERTPPEKRMAGGAVRRPWH